MQRKSVDFRRRVENTGAGAVAAAGAAVVIRFRPFVSHCLENENRDLATRTGLLLPTGIVEESRENINDGQSEREKEVMRIEKIYHELRCKIVTS